jgi:DNA polymerase-3 subunit chi
VADPRVTFYVLAGADDDGRRAYACRLVEKAYLHDHRVVVRLDTPEEAARFDELLWRFSDRSFVPHERAGASCDAPVIVLAEGEPPPAADLLVNLGRGVPDWYASFPRVAEVIGAGEDSRREGRDRFRMYRERGLEPETHNLGAG